MPISSTYCCSKLKICLVQQAEKCSHDAWIFILCGWRHLRACNSCNFSFWEQHPSRPTGCAQSTSHYPTQGDCGWAIQSRWQTAAGGFRRNTLVGWLPRWLTEKSGSILPSFIAVNLSSFCPFSFLSRLSWSPESKSDLESFGKKPWSQLQCDMLRRCREESQYLTLSSLGGSRTKKKHMRKKRKKHLRSFCFWMEQTFFSCTTAKVEDSGLSTWFPKKKTF